MSAGDLKHTDWEALRREEQRQCTAFMVEDFKRREQEIRRQHLVDALAAIKTRISTHTPEETAKLRTAEALVADRRPRRRRSTQTPTGPTGIEFQYLYIPGGHVASRHDRTENASSRPKG